MNTHELLKGYAAHKKIADATFASNGLCVLEVQGKPIVVSMEANPTQDKLLIAAELARLSDEEIAMFGGALLALNANLVTTESGVIVLEGVDADTVSLMHVFTVTDLSLESFIERMELFLSTAAVWQQRLQQADLGMELDELDELDSPQVMNTDLLKA